MAKPKTKPENTNKKTKPKKTYKKKTKKTDELVQQIVMLRNERYSLEAIAKQLGITKSTVYNWYEETIPPTPGKKAEQIRQEETNLNDQIIRDCKQILREIEEPVQPDWAEYKSSAVARANAYNAWMSAKDRRVSKILQTFNVMMRASNNIVELHGVRAAEKIEIESTVKDTTVGLDAEIKGLMQQMKDLDKKKKV